MPLLHQIYRISFVNALMVDLTLLYFQECISKIMVLAKKANVPFVVDGVSSDIECKDWINRLFSFLESFDCFIS